MLIHALIVRLVFAVAFTDALQAWGSTESLGLSLLLLIVDEFDVCSQTCFSFGDATPQ